MRDDSKSLDLLGAKPVGDAVKIATEGMFKGAGEFLGRICLPAAEEFGLLLRDRVSHWRASHAARIAERAEAKLAKFAGVWYSRPSTRDHGLTTMSFRMRGQAFLLLHAPKMERTTATLSLHRCYYNLPAFSYGYSTTQSMSLQNMPRSRSSLMLK